MADITREIFNQSTGFFENRVRILNTMEKYGIKEHYKYLKFKLNPQLKPLRDFSYIQHVFRLIIFLLIIFVLGTFGVISIGTIALSIIFRKFYPGFPLFWIGGIIVSLLFIMEFSPIIPVLMVLYIFYHYHYYKNLKLCLNCCIQPLSEFNARNSKVNARLDVKMLRTPLREKAKCIGFAIASVSLVIFKVKPRILSREEIENLGVDKKIKKLIVKGIVFKNDIFKHIEHNKIKTKKRDKEDEEDDEEDDVREIEIEIKGVNEQEIEKNENENENQIKYLTHPQELQFNNQNIINDYNDNIKKKKKKNPTQLKYQISNNNNNTNEPVEIDIKTQVIDYSTVNLNNGETNKNVTPMDFDTDSETSNNRITAVHSFDFSKHDFS